MRKAAMQDQRGNRMNNAGGNAEAGNWCCFAGYPLHGGGSHSEASEHRPDNTYGSNSRADVLDSLKSVCIHGHVSFSRSDLENLSANPNGQQQKHKAGCDQVGEHDQPRSGKFFGQRMSTQNQTATMKLHAEKNAATACM